MNQEHFYECEQLQAHNMADKVIQYKHVQFNPISQRNI